MKQYHVYDLDGTLSKLNNTFDFIVGFHTRHHNWIRLLLFKLLCHIPVNIRTKRKWSIYVTFFGLGQTELEEYWWDTYISIFCGHYTCLGHRLLESTQMGNTVLLTGCTSIPARQIAKHLSIEQVVCTEFAYTQKGKIFGLTQDSYGDNKLNLLNALLSSPRGQHVTYYTDTFHNEQMLIAFCDDVFIFTDIDVVKYNEFYEQYI